MSENGDSVVSQSPGGADAHWRMVAEAVPHLTWIASPDGHIECMNRQGNEYIGWSPEAPADRDWFAPVHPDDVSRTHRAWAHATRTGTPYVAECRLRRADGQFRWHIGRSLPFRAPDGAVVKWIGTATDIDDSKHSMAAVGDDGDQLAEAQRLAQVGSWYLDVQTGRRVWSDELYRLFGYEPQESVPTMEMILERLHPDDADAVRTVALGYASQPEPYETEFRIVLPDGAVRWLAVRTEPVLSPATEIVGVHGTAQDITARKLDEERLRFQAQLLDAVGEAVIATDLTGTIVYWGPGAETLYGWTAQEAIGRSILETIPTVPPMDETVPAELVLRSSQSDAPNRILQLGRRDGSVFLAQVTYTPVLDGAGRVVAFIGISSDVTVREESHAELAQAHRTTAEAMTLLATLQAEAPIGFAFIDLDYRFVRINQELANMIGASLDELVGRVLSDVAPSLWKRLDSVYREVLETGRAVRNRPVIERTGADGGEVRESLSSHYPVRVGDEIIGIGSVVVDITERVRAEGFRSAVMGQVADGVYTQDRDGRLMYMNRAASKMLGWGESELRGKRMHDVVHFQTADGTQVPAEECALLTEASFGRLERSGEVFTRKDGSTFPVGYSAEPLRTGSTVEGVAVVFCDISQPGWSPNVIRVVLACSDKATTRSFQALLDRHDGIEVVAVATTSATAIEGVARLRPDVVLVNRELPDAEGLVTAATIKASSPTTNVILMTDNYDDSVALASLEAGCAGVLDKSRAWVELVSAVRAAYHGETIISQAELQRVLSKARGGGQAGRAARLTEREEEVLACMREGLPNAMVAQRLGVTANTVRNHVQRILYKLDVHSKLEAVVVTSQEGLLSGRR